ncbi:MAG TPA: alpha/beta hydrolase [Chloroflexia bacterium]|nr:alpha/beta hydrolase [Chloroflexia bacterium]
MWMFEENPPKPHERLRYGSGLHHFGDLRLPAGDGPFPVVISIHGGFWRARYNLEYMGHLCEDLAKRGIATWNIEYRRIGDEGGGWPGTLQDVGQAADFLREIAEGYNLDLKRVVSLGHSAGGHLALWLAARQRLSPNNLLYSPEPLRLKGAVSQAGVTDLQLCWQLKLSNNVAEEFLGGSPERFPERYREASPAELLPLSIPQWLVHGTEDENVPFVLSESYAQKASALGDKVYLLPLPGAGHFEVVDPHSAEWQVVVEAVRSGLDLQ